MSETNSTEPQKGETADQFKERIAETQRELKRAEKAAEKAAPAPVVNTAQVAPPATTGGVPATQTTEKKPIVTGNPELDEWLAKKGPMTVENLASSYRESEREMYRKMEEAKRSQGQPPVTPQVAPPAQGYPPYYPPQPPEPAWGPPAYIPPQPQPHVSVESLAKQYGLSPEDFERVAPLVNDMAKSVVDSTLKRVLPPIMNQMNGVNREVNRQKEVNELSLDPVFKNPQVQFEMDRIFAEEPNTFVAQAQPIRYAYEKALTRIARSNLGGSTGQPAPIAQGAVPSGSRPPATAGGNGNGGGGAPAGTTQEMTPQIFAGLSMAEKTAYLTAVGARPN